MLPSHIVSFNLLICERALQEADNVISAIRLVDVFFTESQSDSPTNEYSITLWVIAAGKRQPSNVEDTIEIRIVRPDGASPEKLKQFQIPPSSEERPYPQAPAGFSIVVKVTLALKQVGTHYVVALINGNEVARSPFTLVEQQLVQAAR